jgi:uncharacterized protein (TIGR02246 family)
MRQHVRRAAAIALASSLPLSGCGPSEAATPTAPSRAIASGPAFSRANGKESPQERAVVDAMENLKQAVLAGDTGELARIWTDDYTFINPQGAIVTKAQRLANFASGNTNVGVIDNEREITVRLYGDAAIVQNLSTLRGTFSGQPTETDLRGTFVWVRRDGRWRLTTNQLTPVVP